MKIPPSHKSLGMQPSAVEARHFAATWALFRISSGKNIHMMLPPTYRDLWKAPFQDIKKLDLENGKIGLYAADPFQARKEHEDELVQQAKNAEQRDKERRERQEQQDSGALLPDRRDFLKGWMTAPKVELGKRIRREVESLVKTQAVWNPNNLRISSNDTKSILEELTKLGFRQSHITEAISICKDREEVLHFLLIHTPEDDLPKWSLPEGYAADISLASGNLKRDTIIQRLSSGGYASELCQEMLFNSHEDEDKAAAMLQDTLLRSNTEDQFDTAIPCADISDAQSCPAAWSDEQTVLESIFADRYARISATSCRIMVDAFSDNDLCIIFKAPVTGNYPSVLPVALVTGPIPAYVRLSITRELLEHTRSSFLGEPMIFNMVDWLEREASRILKHPGSLIDISAAGSSGPSSSVAYIHRREQPRTRSKVTAPDFNHGSVKSQKVLSEWNVRQTTAQQQKMLAMRRTLPAWSQQEAIISAVASHQVVIVSGETGSGKSTQVVQFILDSMIRDNLGDAANFICTQPRRISALGLADRVSAERCEEVGSEIGYSIRGESRSSNNTRITFCTTGVLLRRLQTSGQSAEEVGASIADVSHVFVDEVHERSLDTDFLLALLREILRTRKDLKVILMSATLDAKIFENYFGGSQNVAKVDIEGRTFPVEDLYLDDVLQFTGYSSRSVHDDGEDEMTRDESVTVSKGIQSLGMGINYSLIVSLIRHMDSDPGTQSGGILIFLPGTIEINRTLDLLRSFPNLHTLPLHASLLPDEQRRVFPPAPYGKRKIVASTNVAETSITIPDIIAVIDTGRVKETQFDAPSSTVKLMEVWASKAACKQRRGRAGRVQAGKCYKLFTRSAEAKMAERPEPEIRRVPLEQLALSVKAMGVVDVPLFLQGTITPPDDLAVDGALKLLSRMGALDGSQLTALGQHMAIVPADLRCAKLMVYGALFGCLEASVTMASIFTVRNPFVSPQGKRDESDAARLAFGPDVGDILVSLRAYDAWNTLRTQTSFREVRTWCEQNFLSFHTLNDIASTRSQYLSTLKEIGFLPLSYHNKTNTSNDKLNRNASSVPLLQALLLSALHPNTLRILYPPQKYAATATGSFAIDPEAKSIKLFTERNTRAFIHPSSTLFSAQSFPSSRGGGGVAGFLTYWSKVETSKVMVREVTPVGSFGILLFAGNGVEVDSLGRGLVVDGWIRVRGWARIGVLVSRLRSVLDQVLRGWIEEPGITGADVGIVDLVKKLVELDGLDA